MNLRINPERPIEPLIGDNRRYVRWKCGQLHCMTSLREACRQMRPRNILDASPALRRGMILCVAETMYGNRQLFQDVMAGRI